jgi:hypothetical protein
MALTSERPSCGPQRPGAAAGVVFPGREGKRRGVGVSRISDKLLPRWTTAELRCSQTARVGLVGVGSHA